MLYTFALTWHSAWHTVGAHSINVLLNECMVLGRGGKVSLVIVESCAYPVCSGLGKTVF